MKLLLIILSPVLLISCGTLADDTGWSSRDFRNLSLPGYVYTSENLPCEGADVRLYPEGEDEPFCMVETDIHGRFLFPGVGPGLWKLSCSKRGMEDVSLEFELNNPFQLVYVKMTSIETLLKEAESALDSGSFVQADEILNRILSISSGQVYGLFLLAVLRQGQGRTLEAQVLLEDLARRGVFDVIDLNMTEVPVFLRKVFDEAEYE